MLHFMQNVYQDAWKPKLSRRIGALVFLSLILVEGVVLIPSYFNRRRELLLAKETASQELLTITKEELSRGYDIDEIKNLFKDLDKKTNVNKTSIIKGAALYTIEGSLISRFGEPVQIVPNMNQAIKNHRLAKMTNGGKRYEVAWCSYHLNYQYILIVSHDSSDIGAKLFGYVGRIFLAVFIIAIVVTGSTMIIVTVTIITPFLKLKDDFDRVVDAIKEKDAKPCFETLSAIQLRSQMDMTIQDEMTEVFTAFHQMFDRIYDEMKQRQAVESALREEQSKSDKLLLNVLPACIADRLKEKESAIADKFESVTILFADLVNFTTLSTHIMPVDLVCLLNNIFSRFDDLAEANGLEKIKTIGDAYMVVGGIPMEKLDHAQAIANMALQMREALTEFNTETNQNFALRIGINTGPVVAGVIGRRKFAYDLWGDTVNVASRMESHGIPGKIQVTHETYLQIRDSYHLEPRGKIAIKGRGELETYFLNDRLSAIEF